MTISFEAVLEELTRGQCLFLPAQEPEHARPAKNAKQQDIHIPSEILISKDRVTKPKQFGKLLEGDRFRITIAEDGAITDITFDHQATMEARKRIGAKIALLRARQDTSRFSR